MKKAKTNKEALKTAEIVESLRAVTKEKSIGMEMVLETLRDALVTAAKKFLGTPVFVEAKVDREKGTIEVYTRQTVVDVVEDPERQISLADAKEIDDGIVVGEELEQSLDISRFGRLAVQTAKQVIVQRVREAEREKVFTDYSERVGEIVTGKVQQVERGNILIDLERTEALLPYREQIRKEHYTQGQNIRACVIDVRNNIKGPQVIVSRTCPEFLSRLFENEVPEIFDKTVKIVKVVRDPGRRSKIAVTTTDQRVDPVGACVGMRGNRVQNIVRELSNERIDIINWTDELSLLVRRVFAPAEVKRVMPVGDHKIVVVIAEDGLAMAIGHEGQNIRLASKMLGREIDVFGDDEFSNLSEEQKAEILSETPVEKDKEAPATTPTVDGNITVDTDDDTAETVVDDKETPEEEESINVEIINKAVETLSETDDDSKTAIESTNSD